MKLIRFGNEPERPGVLLPDGVRLDVSRFCVDYDQTFSLSEGPERLKMWLERNLNGCPVISAETRLGPCVARPSKIICVGLNYAKHARESGMAVPEEPSVVHESFLGFGGAK
jgi:2,4-diketo-3-deoxy-L-fuconate hydrolase